MKCLLRHAHVALLSLFLHDDALSQTYPSMIYGSQEHVAVNAIQFEESDSLQFCLRSLYRNANSRHGTVLCAMLAVTAVGGLTDGMAMVHH